MPHRNFTGAFKCDGFWSICILRVKITALNQIPTCYVATMCLKIILSLHLEHSKG